MKVALILCSLFWAFSASADCRGKVIGHYEAVYHKTYKAASNTFLNNFVGRKNMFAHTFGVPKVAFLGLAIMGENYIAQAIIDRSGKSGQEVLDAYYALLDSNELCDKLGDDYTHPRKVRKLLLEKLEQR